MKKRQALPDSLLVGLLKLTAMTLNMSSLNCNGTCGF